MQPTRVLGRDLNLTTRNARELRAINSTWRARNRQETSYVWGTLWVISICHYDQCTRLEGRIWTWVRVKCWTSSTSSLTTRSPFSVLVFAAAEVWAGFEEQRLMSYATTARSRNLVKTQIRLYEHAIRAKRVAGEWKGSSY